MGKLTLSVFVPFLVSLFAVFSGFIIYRAAWFNFDKHFSLLAESFVHNNLFLNPNNLPDGDFVDFMGKQYLFFGPMPSVLLMPFVSVWGKNFPQMALSLSSLVIIFLAIYKICKKFKFSPVDSLWLANFFVFGTVLYFVGLVNISAYVVQAVGAAFVVLALYEYFTRRRWLLMGILVASAGATRVTLFGSAIFFTAEIFRLGAKVDFKKSFAYFMIPVVLSVFLLGAYNFRRFHSFFDTGYTRNVSVLNKDYYNNKLGWFAPVHISANLYSLFFMAPNPVKRDGVQFALKFPYLRADGFGMAIWFTSPLFIYLVLSRREQYTASAWIASGFLLFPSLIYMGIGASQFGYRYSLDFLPFLFVILLSAFKNGLPSFAKLLIAGGIVFNCFYMLSIWNSYPLLDIFNYLPK